jgi:hypothetical protein
MLLSLKENEKNKNKNKNKNPGAFDVCSLSGLQQ